MIWMLLAGFLVMFMQAGFAMVETGLIRSRNVSHTTAMNLMMYSIAVLGFYVCGFAIMFGGHGGTLPLGGDGLLSKEATVSLFGKPFGLFGHEGFLLAGRCFRRRRADDLSLPIGALQHDGDGHHRQRWPNDGSFCPS